MKPVLVMLTLAALGLAQTATVERNVNLREDASIDKPPLTLLMPPTLLTLLETTKQAGYYHVRTPSNQEGWVWGKNVMLSTAPAPPSAFIGPAEIYPDRTRAPGVTNPDVTQESLSQTICNPSFKTGPPLRPPTSYTNPLKVSQMAEYGDTVSDPGKTCKLHSDNVGCYEEDHLISLENGGHPRDPHNLWPEAYFTRIDGKPVGARQKDTVENYIRNAICFNIAGYVSHGMRANASLTLKRGQEILTGDWYACYMKIKSGSDCQ
jgi:Bacterial SH3 domain